MRKQSARSTSLIILAIACSPGCAHRRDSYYPEDFGRGRGVHVRAPFVDVQVRGKQRLDREPVLAKQVVDPEDRVSRNKHRDDLNEAD